MNTNSNIWKVFKNNIADMGWCNGFLYIFSRLLATATRGWGRLICYQIVAQPVSLNDEIMANIGRGTVVRFVDQHSADFGAFPRPESVIRRRFEDGNLCLMAEVKNRFAGFLWLARRAYLEDEVRCYYVLENPEHCVWDFDVYVEPEFRLGRTFVSLWHEANRYLLGNGVSWSLSRISCFNQHSMQSHLHMGIVPLAKVVFLCMGPVQLMLGNMRPYIHISWSKHDIPVFKLMTPT